MPSPRHGDNGDALRVGDRGLAVAEIRAALAHAEGRPPKPPLGSLVEDVYAEPTPRLREELAALEAEIAKHGPKRSPHG